MQKASIFCPKKYLYSIFSFCKTKGYYYLKQNFRRLCVRNLVSGLLQNGTEFEKGQWSHNFWSWRQIQLFLSCFVFLVKFSYWSKFHVIIITASGIMTIFFYKGLTRNPEIGNNPAWVLPNIWGLTLFIDTKFDTNVSNRMLLNAAKFQGYSFYCFWVIKGKPTGG